MWNIALSRNASHLFTGRAGFESRSGQRTHRLMICVVLLGSSTHQLVTDHRFPLHFQLILFLWLSSSLSLLYSLSYWQRCQTADMHIYYKCVCVCVCVFVCVTSEEKAYSYWELSVILHHEYCLYQYSCFVWVRNIVWKIKFWVNFRPFFCGINRHTHKRYVSSIFTPFRFHENCAVCNSTT